MLVSVNTPEQQDERRVAGALAVEKPREDAVKAAAAFGLGASLYSFKAPKGHQIIR